MKDIVKLLLILTVLYLLASFVWKGIKPATWKGFYYPNASDLTVHKESPVYASLDECREWVTTQVSQYNPDAVGYDYECGKNCKLKEGFTVLVCDETVR